MKDPNATIYVRDLVARRGKQYVPALLPEEVTRFAVGECYDACVLACIRSPRKYRYVEGLATIPDQPDEPILHAWITDGKYAYDPTFGAVDGSGKQLVLDVEYRGIEMPIEHVARFMLHTKYHGIIANRHRAPDLYRACIGV